MRRMQRMKTWLSEKNVLSRKTVLTALLFLGLALYVFSGLYTELWFMHKGPLPEFFLEDFHFYERALWDTLAGGETYGVMEIGPAYLYPPQALLVVELFAWLPRPVVQIAAFISVNIFLYGGMLYLLMKKRGSTLEQTLFVMLLAFTFSPFYEILHIGQINLFTVFGVFLLFYFERRRPVLAGAGLALAILTKVTPLAFVGYLVVRKRWKVLLACLGAVVLISVLALLRYGPEPFVTYPKMFTHMLGEIPDNWYSQAFFRRLQRFLGSESLQGWLSAGPAWLGGAAEAAYRFVTTNLALLQRMVLLVVALALLAGGVLTYLGRLPRQPLFIMVMIGMNLVPNIMWYHHYIWLFFALLLLLLWQNFSPRVLAWVMTSLIVVQIDRFALPTSGLLIHLFAYPTLVGLLVWMARRFRRYMAHRPDGDRAGS
jgi:membrane protein implicated in regulation of membrane protease activity